MVDNRLLRSVHICGSIARYRDFSLHKMATLFNILPAELNVHYKVSQIPGNVRITNNDLGTQVSAVETRTTATQIGNDVVFSVEEAPVKQNLRSVLSDMRFPTDRSPQSLERFIQTMPSLTSLHVTDELLEQICANIIEENKQRYIYDCLPKFLAQVSAGAGKDKFCLMKNAITTGSQQEDLCVDRVHALYPYEEDVSLPEGILHSLRTANKVGCKVWIFWVGARDKMYAILEQLWGLIPDNIKSDVMAMKFAFQMAFTKHLVLFGDSENTQHMRYFIQEPGTEVTALALCPYNAIDIGGLVISSRHVLYDVFHDVLSMKQRDDELRRGTRAIAKLHLDGGAHPMDVSAAVASTSSCVVPSAFDCYTHCLWGGGDPADAYEMHDHALNHQNPGTWLYVAFHDEADAMKEKLLAAADDRQCSTCGRVPELCCFDTGGGTLTCFNCTASPDMARLMLTSAGTTYVRGTCVSESLFIDYMTVNEEIQATIRAFQDEAKILDYELQNLTRDLNQEHEAAKEELNAKERELAEAEAAASQPQQRLRLDGEAIDQLMDQLNSMRLVSEREEERVNQLTTQLTKISANLEDNENLLKEYM